MSPSLQTMGFFMSDINFCNTKEQLNHLGEVVTGKVNGSPTGDDIVTSTLPYTGQVRKTVPSLEQEYLEAIRSAGGVSLGVWAAGVTTFTKYNEYAVFNGISYKPRTTTNLPYVAQGSDPTVAPDSANVQPYQEINEGRVVEIVGEQTPRVSGATFATVSDMKAGIRNDGVSFDFSKYPEYTYLKWLGYRNRSDGGSNWGVLRFGAHTEDGGSIFSINANTYVEANIKPSKINIRKFGADQGIDCSPMLQKIVDLGKGLHVPPGRFKMESGVTELQDETSYTGDGWESILYSETDIQMFQTKDGAAWVQFKDVVLDKYNGDFTPRQDENWHILGVNTFGLKLKNVRLMGKVGFKFSGVCVTDTAGAAGPSPKFNDNTRATGFMTEIEDCFIQQGSVFVSHSDSTIRGGYIWASESVANSSFAIRINNAPNTAVLSVRGIVPSPGYGGAVFIHSDGTGGANSVSSTQIKNNFFDGNPDPAILHNTAIITSSTTELLDSQIQGNTFFRLKAGCVDIHHASNCDISHNQAQNCNDGDLGNSDFRVGCSKYVASNNIIGNVSNITLTRSNAGYFIEIPKLNGFAMRGDISHNTVNSINGHKTDGNYGLINWEGRQLDNSTYNSNTFNGDSNQRIGTATITAGNTQAFPRWSDLQLADASIRRSDLSVQLNHAGFLTDEQYRIDAAGAAAEDIKTGFNITFQTALNVDVEVSYKYKVS